MKKPIIGFSGYEVSDDGRVFSLERKGRRVSKEMKLSKHSGGYVTVRLSSKTLRNNYCVHHLVLCAFVGPRPDGMWCRHLNGIKTDNRLVNLKWGTPKENGQDGVRLGERKNCAKGERISLSVLTKSLVLEIRAAHHLLSINKLAKMYGVSTCTISNVVNRITWRHV